MLAALLLALASLAAPPDEGPLQNDSFVPTNVAAQEAFDRGDALLARVTPEARERLAPERLAPIFDAWQDALTLSADGDLVALVGEHSGLFDDPDGSHDRRCEAPPLALVRRLEVLDDAQRAQFEERFDAASRAAYRDAEGDVARLTRCAFEYPASYGGIAAEVALFDHAFERGLRTSARNRLQRARAALQRLVAPAPALASALDRRAFALSEYRTFDPDLDATWRTAAALAPLGFRAFDVRAARLSGKPRLPARGVLDRMAFLSDGSAVVHAERLVRVLPEDGGDRPFQPWAILAEWGLQVRPAFATAGGAWPLDVDTTGDLLTFVCGRAAGRHGNALLCLDPPEEGAAPRVVWGLSSFGRYGPAGLLGGAPGGEGSDEGEPPLGAGRWEFQPGFIVRDGVLFGLARRWDLSEAEEGVGLRLGGFASTAVDESQAEVWLFALRHADGALLWKRFLARGADVRLDLDRRFGSTGQVFRGATGPLVAAAGRLVCDTGVGVVALVEPAGGRVVWTLKTRRRSADDDGWSAGSPPVAAPAGSGAAAGEPVVTLGPPDSDRLYWLRASPRTGSLFAFPPRAIGEALLLVGGDSDGALVLSRAGARRSLARWGAADGSRFDSLYLGRGERFRGEALASEERVLFASDRALWLFDRSRELFLVDREPLIWPGEVLGPPPPGLELGGSVFARGDRVCVLGSAGVWLFRAVPASELEGR